MTEPTFQVLDEPEAAVAELLAAAARRGGTTIRAIRELERAGVRAAFLNAIQAAMERSRELAQDDK